MERLLDKVAIVTGAAGGIGKAIAMLFAREGACVLATDLQEDKLRSWVTAAQEEGLKIEYAVHDVAVKADWELVAEKAVSLFMHINILVNNAGIYPAGATTDNTTAKEWNRVIAINLTGPFTGAQVCVPYMKRTGSGAVVNISSIAGMVGGNGPAYTASKGGLRLLSKDQAVEFAKDRIRVNSIHPGGVFTPMTDFIAATAGSAEIIKNMCPMERMGDTLEIAYGALYLASDEASYVTGSELVIDGGLIAR